VSYEAASFWTSALLPETSAPLQPSSRVARSFPGVRPLLTAAYVAAGALLVLAIIGFTVIAWYGITMVHD